MPRKLPTPSAEWENLILAGCLHLFLPLLPIIVEWGRTGQVTPSALVLTASMFSITIGTSSRSPALFGITLIISLFFAMQYSLATEPAAMGAVSAMGPLRAPETAWWIIFGILVVHLAERYHRHVVDGEPVLAFQKGAT